MKSKPHSVSSERKTVGILTMGGQASRVSPLPCSKEIYPVGFRTGEDGGARPKAVAQYLLESWREAGVRQVYTVLRPGKWDIPQYFGDGSAFGMGLPYGAPYTLDQAYPFASEATVAFGFPDILFRPSDAFVQLLARQTETKADVVLGVFPAESPQKMDMVELDAHGALRRLEIKPATTDLRYTWILAVWTPTFTRFLHEHLPTRADPARCEVYVGDVIRSAMQAGMPINSVVFEAGEYIDIGTPDDLVRAISTEVARWSRGD